MEEGRERHRRSSGKKKLRLDEKHEGGRHSMLDQCGNRKVRGRVRVRIRVKGRQQNNLNLKNKQVRWKGSSAFCQVDVCDML